jgi:tRNA (mo5U34)-methyltransferase
MPSLTERINALRWFHQIDFGNGVLSPGLAPLEVLKAQAAVYFRDGVKGKTVLDIGCWDGFNSFEAARLGARRVLATDHFTWSSAGWGNRDAFELAREHLAPAVEVMDIDILDITPERVGRFDVVLFCGIFYHLRNPLMVLEHVAKLSTDLLIVESHLDALNEARPAMIFYPGAELNNDVTNWWGPNVPCVEAMLRDLGFGRVEFFRHPIAAHVSRGIFLAHRT